MPGTTLNRAELNRPIYSSLRSNSNSNSSPYIDTVNELIDLLIEMSELTHKFKDIASSLSLESDV